MPMVPFVAFRAAPEIGPASDSPAPSKGGSALRGPPSTRGRGRIGLRPDASPSGSPSGHASCPAATGRPRRHPFEASRTNARPDDGGRRCILRGWCTSVTVRVRRRPRGEHHCALARSGGTLGLLGRCPVPGEEFVDPARGMGRQSGQHVGQPGPGIDRVELGGLGQRVQRRRAPPVRPRPSQRTSSCGGPPRSRAAPARRRRRCSGRPARPQGSA